MRILVVDDDIIIRHYFVRSLRRHADVHEAADIAGARAKMQITSFDVIVADAHLPDGSGICLLEEARTLQAACLGILMSTDDTVLAKGPERSFPKVGGLVQIVALIRATPSARASA